jgi:hypothetical protein
MRRSWTPSIVPNGTDQTVYLVLNDFGRLGRAYCEASEDRSDLETTISDLIAGQYDNPLFASSPSTPPSVGPKMFRNMSPARSCAVLVLLVTSCHHRLRASSTGISVPTVSLPCGLAL